MSVRKTTAAARLGRGPARDGPDRDHGRRHGRDLLDDPGRRGGNGLELRGAARGRWRAWPVLRALHRPRQPLHPYPEARGRVSSSAQTQVGRALAHLGIEHIAAYSPQARGRSERLFATLQDRLPQGAAAGRDRHQSRRPTRGSRPTTSPACHYDQNRLIFLLVLRTHHPLAVLGAENVIMHVGDPLPA